MRFAHNDIGSAPHRESYRLYERADVGHRALGSGTEKVGVSGNIRKSFVQELAESVKFIVSERGVEADYAQIGILFVKFYAVQLEFALEPVVAEQKHFLPAVIVEEILTCDLTARIDFVGVSAQTEIVEPCDIVGVHSRRVVRKEANALAH